MGCTYGSVEERREMSILYKSCHAPVSPNFKTAVSEVDEMKGSNQSVETLCCTPRVFNHPIAS
jgi:hypothetical protein